MTPAARTQAAIDLLDRIAAAAREQGPAADTIIARWFAERRYAGSKDRRAIRALVYDCIRLCGEAPASGRSAALALARARADRQSPSGGADSVNLVSTFDGSPYGPAKVDPDEPVEHPRPAPIWLEAAFAASGLDGAEIAALLERAPLDVRVNRVSFSLELLAAQIPGAEPIAHLPDALRLPADTPVERLPAFAEGAFEVQDAGSQAVTLAAGAQPGMHVIDLCAGGGGKTLALAAAMANHGTILACDVDRTRLSRLSPRAERAGVNIVETRLLDPKREAAALADQTARADIVLIDAPCSGTGTWRRNPEARWRLTPDRLARVAETQARLIDIGADLVRPGGALVYIVCSLLDVEGAGQVDRFVAARPDWAVAPLSLGLGHPRHHGLRLTPLADSTDGFFVAKLIRP